MVDNRHLSQVILDAYKMIVSVVEWVERRGSVETEKCFAA